MEQKILGIINKIREAKELYPMALITAETKLREDLNLTSFELADHTVSSRFI